jgi:hypothetical protein
LDAQDGNQKSKWDFPGPIVLADEGPAQISALCVEDFGYMLEGCYFNDQDQTAGAQDVRVVGRVTPSFDSFDQVRALFFSSYSLMSSKSSTIIEHLFVSTGYQQTITVKALTLL